MVFQFGGAFRHDGIVARSVVAVAGAAAVATMVAAPAYADTTTPKSDEPTSVPPSLTAPSEQTETEKPGVPQPVAEGSFGYIATPAATRWMADRHPENIIANLPVGHRRDNRAMAERLGGQLEAAVSERGACVQVIVGGPRDGGLFTYGFYAIEPEYCPR